MSFEDIKGQDKAISFLRSSIENNRIAHAYIFTGPSGVGKKITALNYAKALNCLADTAERPCNKCISCTKIESSNHPDVFLVKPDKTGRSETSSVKIDAIREIIRSIGLKPYEGRYKVYIIDNAGGLTEEASNAILKTLEEPPANSVMILIVENLDALLSTILSRCQVVKFFPLGIDEVENILIKEYKLDTAKAHILSRLLSGSLGEALKHNDEKFFKKRASLLKALSDKRISEYDFDGVSKEDLKMYLDIMLTWYRDILVAKVGNIEKEAFVNIDKKDLISSQAKSLEADYIDGIIKDIISTNYFLDRSANPKLAMSVLALRASGER